MTQTLRRAAVGAALAALVTVPSQAQRVEAGEMDGRWRAFLGCWESGRAGVRGPIVCVVPGGNAQEVEFVSLTPGDSILERMRIDAGGSKRTRTRDDCKGWEQGMWSADDRRIYTTAEYTCPDGIVQKSSSILSLAERDIFTRIEGLRSRERTGVNLLSFVAVTDSGSVPAAIRQLMPDRNSMRSMAARTEAAAPLELADVADAARHVDAPVVEAWLADRQQVFTLSASELRALKESQVPDRVIDMVVAVSNPQVFALAAGGVMARSRTARTQPTAEELLAIRAGRGGMLGAGAGYSPWMYGFDPFYGYGGFYGWPFSASRFGFNQFNFGPGWDSFSPYGGYGYGFGSGWISGNTPIVIVPQDPVRDRGRVVNGQGYVQGGSGSGGGAQPRPQVSNGGGWSGGSSSVGGASSGGSSSAGSSTSGGGEARTAKPRP